MGVTLRRLPALAGLAVLAGTCAELTGHRAFARLVRRDVEALRARASPGQAGVVTEEMLADLPEPVRRYLRYTGVVGKPVPATIRLRQKGRMRPGPGQPWMPLDAEEHYSVQPPGFVWAGVLRLGPLPVGRARDMYAEGRGRLTDFVAKRYRTADASSPETWSTPIIGYGEYEGLRLPVRGKAIYKLPGGEFEYIEVTITDLHYDTGAAAPEGRAR
jgi:hypothetical protein